MTQEESPEVDSQPGVLTSESSRGANFAVAVWHMVERVARWTVHQLSRPRVRTSVVGVILILIAALFVGHSFWTAPLVIVGALMIIVAWVGSRLEGRFAVEWSETGTGFEMHARFKSASASSTRLIAPQTSVSDSTQTTAPAASPRATHTPGATTSTGSDDDVIEGEAHTMEIDPEELRALVAAVEQVVVQRGDDSALSHAVSSNGNAAAAQAHADDH